MSNERTGVNPDVARVICDGCRVRGVWEHRCFYNGCACSECGTDLAPYRPVRNETMKKPSHPTCPMCKRDNTRQMSNNGKLMQYAQCFDCRNVWAFDKGLAFLGDIRPGYGWPT